MPIDDDQFRRIQALRDLSPDKLTVEDLPTPAEDVPQPW